jgi:HAD superfamily hydrolase (TIGR01509 family)
MRPAPKRLGTGALRCPGESARQSEWHGCAGVAPVTLAAFPEPAPVEGVLFDFHCTLVDQGDGRAWIDHAWRHAGRTGSPADALGEDEVARLAHWVERIWDGAREIDPHNRRDLDSATHRDVYDRLVRDVPSIDDELAHALYATVIEPWIPYDDAVPVLEALRSRGIRTALVSNVGVDIRVVLDRAGMSGLLDAVVLSYEAGVVKPDATIFSQALEAIGVAPERALMVGDSWRDDAGAAGLGIRTLLLPRTSGPTHGLDMVLRLVG